MASRRQPAEMLLKRLPCALDTGCFASQTGMSEHLLRDFRPYLDSVNDKSVAEAKIARTKVSQCSTYHQVRLNPSHFKTDGLRRHGQLSYPVCLCRCYWAKTRPSGTGTSSSRPSRCVGTTEGTAKNVLSVIYL